MENMTMQPRIGIDIGRVIIESDQPGGDTSFIGGGLEDVLRTPAILGALETIARLTVAFSGKVWLVSKCGRRMEEKTWIWLRDRQFFAVTGVPESHVRFCRERPEKADHARQLGLTHFVDDRLDVLEHLRGVVSHLYLFGAAPQAVPDWVRAVSGWADAETDILATLPREEVTLRP
jgi:hypothetical protein